MTGEFSRSLSSLANVMAEFDAAARRLSLSPDQIAFIKEPRCTLKLKLPVQLDGGKVQVFPAYHTIHSIMRGPCVGGVQFRPAISWETVEAFAFWSTHRSALLGIPFGGSAGAVECDPSMFSASELERISRRYVAELSDVIKPNYDMLTSDIGTSQQIMCWLMDTYSMHCGNFEPAVVLGKPTDLGGTFAPVNLAAVGADLCVRRALKLKNLGIEGATVAIQGFGKVGMNTARLLSSEGAKIVAVEDISGAYFNKNGINVNEVCWHQESYGILYGVEADVDVKKLSDPKEMFALDVDILVLAAIELQITEENAHEVKAKIVAEIAHDPVSPAADRILYQKNVLVIPDILCGGGGMAGYYLEWVQNRMGYYWTAQRMQNEVRHIVGNAFDNVTEIANKNKIPLRLAAAELAVGRLSRAAKLRGVYA